MKIILHFSLAFIVSSFTAAAQDTLVSFLDQNYNSVDRDGVVYIRTVITNNDKVLVITGNTEGQNIAYNEYKLEEELVLNGQSIFYHDPGKVYSKGYYENGLMVGDWMYYLGYLNDSVVMVNYDSANALISASDCNKTFRQARFVNSKTGIDELEVMQSLKKHIEANVLIPGLYIKDFIFNDYQLELVYNTDGQILCPTFIIEENIDTEIAQEILRTLTFFRYDHKPTHAVKLIANPRIENNPYKNYLPFDSIVFNGRSDELESLAYFRGGEKRMMEFIAENLMYPGQARDKGVQGTVYVAFTVDATGQLKDFEILSSVHPLLDEAALQLFALSPPWIPAIKDGKPVASRYNVPIQFFLEDNNKTRKNR